MAILALPSFNLTKAWIDFAGRLLQTGTVDMAVRAGIWVNHE